MAENVETEHRSILLNCILLLFHESRIGALGSSTDLIKKVLQKIKKTKTGNSDSSQIVPRLRDYLIQLNDQDPEIPILKSEVLKELSIIAGHEERFYNIIEKNLDREFDKEESSAQCQALANKIHKFFEYFEVMDIFTKALKDFRYSPENVGKLGDYVSTVMHDLDPYVLKTGQRESGVISMANSNSTKYIDAVFNKVADKHSGKTLLKFGLRRLNTWFGGGLARGTTTGIMGLRHQNKSGLCLKLMSGNMLYNDPVLNDPTKKPLIALISTENTNDHNISTLYKILVEQANPGVMLTREMLDNIPVKERGMFVHNMLTQRGWHYSFTHINPSVWTINNLKDWVIRREREGYEIVALYVDYLNKLSTEGFKGRTPGAEYKDLTTRTRDFMMSKDIAFITPYQLNKQVANLKSSGAVDFLRQVAEDGTMTAGSGQISMELDNEIFINISTVENKSYLTMYRGKFRSDVIVPKNLHSACYEFTPEGMFYDDIMLDKDMSTQIPDLIDTVPELKNQLF